MNKNRYAVWSMAAFIFAFSLLLCLLLSPRPVYAADSYTISKITLVKQYSSVEIPDTYYLTIEGSNLGSITAQYLNSKGKLITLTNPTGGDGVKQYTIDPDDIGTTLYIDGPGGNETFDISETNMSRIISFNPSSIEAGNDLENLKVDNYSSLGSASDAEYKAYYYDEVHDVDISSQLGSNGTGAGITVNTTGVYNIRFERNFNSNGVPINISYRYIDIFRVYGDLTQDGVSSAEDISMFPNRGEPESTVYFRAPELSSDMSVFFLNKDDGTDSFTQANKGTDFTYQKDAEEDAEGNKTIDIVTVKVPSGLTPGDEYYVYFTNQISDSVDPMQYVCKQLELSEQFMVINVADKVQVYSVSPASGPDTGQNITITGRYLGTLNISGLTPGTGTISDDNITMNSDSTQLTIKYGAGTYSGQDVSNITKTVRVNIANSAVFQSDSQKAANFTLAADRIYVKTPTFPITNGQNTTYPVEVRTTTAFVENGVTYTFEEFTSYTGFTFIPSMISPAITSVTPDKIEIESNPDNTYTVKNNTLFAIYGSNFKIYRETQSDGSVVVRYPIVRILNGSNTEIEINMNTGEILEDGNTVSGQTPQMYIFDASGNLLDGSDGKQTGTKILVTIPQGVIVTKPDSDASPRSVMVVNPIKNSSSEGISYTAADSLQFVLTDQDPVISSIEPDVVTVAGGQSVTIKGGNFRSGVKVIIDGQEVSNITRDGAGQTLTFKAPAGRVGETQLQVLNPEGGMAVWPFTYVSTYTNPKITDFQPKSGNTGTLVVVTGQNFLTPDPTAAVGEVEKLIGTRVLLGSQDVSSYNREDQYNRISLQDYSNSTTPVIDSSGKLADYYYSVVFEDDNQKYYVLQQEPDGTVELTGGTQDNTYIITAASGILTATKVNGGSYGLTVNSDGTGLTLDATGLTMETPYLVEDGVITGNHCHVISSSEIHFTVPILSADGYYDLTVINPDTNSDSKTGTQGFYYYMQPQSKPVISSIVPAQGSTAGGYTININGSGFQDDGVDKTAVSINGIAVAAKDTAVSADGKMLTVVVPAYPGDLLKDKGTSSLSVPVVVLNPDGASAGDENGFTYIVPSSYPKIIKIVPAQGSAAGGDVVEITGSDFRFFEPFTDANRNQTCDNNESYSDLNSNGQWDDYTGQTVAALEKQYGDQYDSRVTPVLPVVYFGSTKATVEEFSQGYLKVLSPAGTIGTVEVYVVNNDSGISNQVSFTYQGSNPKITSIVPDQGKKQGGDNIEIYGSGFASSSVNIVNLYEGADTITSKTMPLVRFGSITNTGIARDQANSGRIDNERTTVNLDGGLTVEYDATGTSPQLTVELTSSGDTFSGTYDNYDGSVEFIDLSTLTDTVGTKYSGYELLRVEINDRRLLVDRGYAPNVTWSSSSQLLVQTPSYYGIGVVPVTVINPDACTASGQFEYKNPASSPTITDITRDGNEATQDSGRKVISVTYKGGNIISVLGTDFRENAVIQIGNVLKIDTAAITYTLPNKLTFTMPAVDKSQVEKLLPVIVINEDGGSASSEKATPLPIYLEFIEGESAPQITSISPAAGPASGGIKVTITGKDFRTGLKVYFGENQVADANVTLVDYKTIVVVTPAGSAGKVKVKVENSDGSLSNLVDFDYLSCPAITSVVDPTDTGTKITSISVKGGDEIEIKGSDFMTGGKVVFCPTITKLDSSTTSTASNIIYLAGVPYSLDSGTAGSDFSFIDENTITVKTPAGKLDTGGIIVINSDNGASSIYTNITYGLPTPQTPSGVVAELVYDQMIKVHWTKVDGARYYDIYVEIDGDDPAYVDTTQLTDYVYKDIKSYTDYQFIIKAIADYASSAGSEESNEVSTGRIKLTDEDGSLGENTVMSKAGATALVTVGSSDDGNVVINLNRGSLAGCKTLVISLPTEVITDHSSSVKVSGPDYVLQFSPRVFDVSQVESNADADDAGVRFTVTPYSGSLGATGGNALSTVYQFSADAYSGKKTSAITALAGSMNFSLDYNTAKSNLRQLDIASLSHFNEYSDSWQDLNSVLSSRDTEVSADINQMGRYVVMGSRG